MYLIGLTGNIATGKSTVSEMLEQLGARVIDADTVAHSVLRRGTPAWRAVVKEFGYDILYSDGRVNRRKLGSLVFNDPARLRVLEAIVHPAVGAALALKLREVREPVVVIEAVKLYEAGLAEYCDALWVVTAPEEEQRRRLIKQRKLSSAEADARLRAQPPLAEKLARATVVIDNGGDIEDTRVQVLRAFAAIDPERAADKTQLYLRWLGLVASEADESSPRLVKASGTAAEGPLTVERARPSDATALASLLAKIEGRSAPLERAEVLERLGREAYWLARSGRDIVALAAWRTEDLVGVVRDLWASSPQAADRALPLLLDAIEKEADVLKCEVLVVAMPERTLGFAGLVGERDGFRHEHLEALHPLWRSTVEATVRGGETLYVKQLREMATTPN